MKRYTDFRYTDFELIPNLKLVPKKENNFFLFIFEFKYRFEIRYRPEIGRYRLNTDLSFDCNVIFAGAENELYKIQYRHQFDTDFDTDFVQISYRFQYRNRYRCLGISAEKYQYRYRIQNPIPFHH